MATVSSSLPTTPKAARQRAVSGHRSPIPVVVSLCVVAACLPLVVAHLQQLWLRPHYQFFPVLLVGVAVLAWQRLHAKTLPPPADSRLGAVLAGVTWLLLVVAILLDSSWLGMVAFQIGVAAVAIGLGGVALFRLLLPAWILLWLIVPPPFEYDRTLVLALQTLTTQQSSQLLDLFGVYHGVSGHQFEVNGQALMVEQACAGVNSLLSVLACTVFFVFFVRRPVVRGILLVLSALFWVICANVARVFLVVMLFASSWHIDLTKGYQHETLGLVLFALALGLIWSTDRLLALLAAPVPIRPVTPVAAVAASPAPARSDANHWTWLAYWPCGAAFALLVAFYMAAHLLTATLNPFGHGPTLATLGSLNKDSLPKAQGACSLRDFVAPPAREQSNEFGEFSRTWFYKIGDNEGHVSLAYPFPNWHDLTRCYTSQGWEVVDEKVLIPAEPKAGEVGFVQYRLKKPGFRTGYLLLCEFDGNGTLLEPRGSGSDLSWHRQASFFSRLVNFGKSEKGLAPIDPPGPIYQLQLFMESAEVKRQGIEETEALKLFQEAAKRIRLGNPS